MIRFKRNVSRNASRCLTERQSESAQLIVAFNSQTEFVKYVFLFFMNLVEWLGLLSAILIYLKNVIHYNEGGSHRNDSNDIIEYTISCHPKGI